MKEKYATMCAIYNEVAAMADRKGVPVDVHPHSHHGSVIETAEEYEMLMAMTDPSLVGWCPDTGHIVRGGLDLLGTLRRYGARIRNVHLKDADENGKWKALGDGICDVKAVLQLLRGDRVHRVDHCRRGIGRGFQDQRAAIRKNREYLRSLGY